MCLLLLAASVALLAPNADLAAEHFETGVFQDPCLLFKIIILTLTPKKRTF